MFLGKMQSFYRRNSIYNQSSQTSKPKEQIKRVKHISKHKNDVGGEDYQNAPIRRSRNSESAGEYNRTDVPAITIGMYEPEASKKSNILKEKEKALWYNMSPVLDDNNERLGPNKNNIIEETLEVERRKSGDWGGHDNRASGLSSADFS